MDMSKPSSMAMAQSKGGLKQFGFDKPVESTQQNSIAIDMIFKYFK